MNIAWWHRFSAPTIPLGDILADSGYAHRDADAWALPLRAAGAQLVQDLHPHDRGPKGTHDGAIASNGNMYCPKTPAPAAGARVTAPATPRRTSRRARRQDRRAGPLQARPPHPRRPRRLPPRRLPRRHGQDPLPPPARLHDAGPGPARNPRSPRSTRPPAAPGRPSPSRPRSPRKPRRNTTTRPQPTASPTPAAPAPNAASPPPRTPPATPSAAAGAASWAWPP